MSNKNRAWGVVRVGLELGRQGLQVNRSPSPTSPVGLWTATLGSCHWEPGAEHAMGWEFPASRTCEAETWLSAVGHFPFLLVLGPCHLGLNPPGNGRQPEKGNKSLFLPLSPQIPEPKLLTHSLGLFPMCRPRKPAPSLRVAPCRFCPPSWLRQSALSPYPTLEPSHLFSSISSLSNPDWE